jgi:rhamnose transport system substrate-binding protein
MGEILGGASTAEGATLSMGSKGETVVGADGEAVMGEPFEFNKDNVAEFAAIF